jgi:cytochrome c oxidase subunit 3
MWVFLATEVLFFGVLFFGYTTIRLHYADAFAAASRHTDIVLGSINTGVLLTSSLAMAMAVRSVSLGARRAGAVFLCATLVLGSSFVPLHGFNTMVNVGIAAATAALVALISCDCA